MYNESLLADQPLLPSLGARLLAPGRSKTPDALLFDVTQQRVASDVDLSCRWRRVSAELSVAMFMLTALFLSLLSHTVITFVRNTAHNDQNREA